jgi:uncharacterized protein involved in exopolysaccharide biosynthesis
MASPTNAVDPILEWADVLVLATRHRVFLVSLTLFGALLGLGFRWLVPASFVATAIIDPSHAARAGIAVPFGLWSGSEVAMDVERMSSRSNLSKARQALPAAQRDRESNAGPDDSDHAWVRHWRRDLVVREAGRRSGLIEARFGDPDPARALAVLRAIVDAYLNASRADSERTLALRRQALFSRLPDVRQEALSMQARSNELQRAVMAQAKGRDLPDLAVELARLDAERNDLKGKLAQIELRFGTRHPEHLALLRQQAKLAERRTQVSELVQSLATQRNQSVVADEWAREALRAHARLQEMEKEWSSIAAGAPLPAVVVDEPWVDTTRHAGLGVVACGAVAAGAALLLGLASLVLVQRARQRAART